MKFKSRSRGFRRRSSRRFRGRTSKYYLVPRGGIRL